MPPVPPGTAVVVALTLALAGCAEGDAGSTTAGNATSSPTGTSGATAAPSGRATAASARTVRLRIRDGEVQPPARRVDVPVGATVRLVVTSDVADEMHVHGYDETLRLRPGATRSLELTADVPGVFEVETHESGALLVTLQVS